MASTITCPSCGTDNSVRPDPKGRPRCSSCKARLPWMVDVLGVDEFEAEANTPLPVVVDLWAPWCGPCRTMAPAFEEAASKLEPGVRLAKLNTEDEQMIGSRLGIRSIPTMILFRNGKETARQSGAMMAGDIVRWVQAQMSQ